MNTVKQFLLAAGFCTASLCAAAQQPGVDSTGLPGDNFSLQGALQLFQNATSPEDFEKQLNTEANHVNNLDLNGDGEIDYIRVIDKTANNAHALVLQAAVSANESQDIAVIEIEKTGDTTAVLQIIGDEDIFGEAVIVEPDGGGEDEEDGAFINFYPSENRGGPFVAEVPNARIVINVWGWPSVRFVYGPAYRPWASPWRWAAYPLWWKPWRPYAWRVYHPYRAPWHRSFVVVRTHRVIHAHTCYKPYRTTSAIVRTRHAAPVGNYRVSRSKTKVTGPRGNSVIRTKTTVRGPGGNVRAQKVNVRKRRG
jgi:hypothetical protein